jgi:hypothetical protein
MRSFNQDALATKATIGTLVVSQWIAIAWKTAAEIEKVEFLGSHISQPAQEKVVFESHSSIVESRSTSATTSATVQKTVGREWYRKDERSV